MFKPIIKLSAATILSLSLFGGVAAASPNHSDKGGSSTVNICTQINKNKVSINNFNGQYASTGNAKVLWNTKGGSATSGDASNTNTTVAAVTVNNSGSCCGCTTSDVQSSDKSKDSSSLNVQTTVNSNNVWVGNVSFQGASSGNATVLGNTGGGTATSGDASNTNTTVATVTVTNN